MDGFFPEEFADTIPTSGASSLLGGAYLRRRLSRVRARLVGPCNQLAPSSYTSRVVSGPSTSLSILLEVARNFLTETCQRVVGIAGPIHARRRF